ncbi:MAG: outer membrane beta-barrel protein [Bacteroidetes bacterium]|nr:outer membrane beta-barrel protein [Bacteroidota bacterium]
MKTVIKVTLLATVAVLLCTSTGKAQFHEGGSWLGPVLTLATDPIGFGAQYEYGVSENIGIGGIVRYWGKSESIFGHSWSWSVVMPQFQAAYHFMPGDQLDPYAGARLGFALYSDNIDFTTSSGSSGLFLTAYGGLRYFFSPTIAGNGQLEFRVAGDDYFGGSLQLTVGVDFVL